MLQRYTFLNHPFEAILSNSRRLINGLDRCVAIFYNHQTNKEQALMYDGELNNLSIESVDFINKIRVSTKKANWIKPEQVPFEAKNHQAEQLSFIDEEESSVLELRFANAKDKKSDVLYFYFKNHIGNFKLSNTNEAMGVAIKEVIQNLMYNQIVLYLNDYYSNKEVHSKVVTNPNFDKLQFKVNSLQDENFKQIKETYSYILNELTSEEDTDFVLSKSAINKIRQSNIPLKEVKATLQHSLEVLVNQVVLGKVYEISDYDIIVTPKNASTKTVVEESLEKTAQFLDRYEQAANLLASKQLKITGVNIGAYCEPNISAAAISDILKKHHKKIAILLERNPEKWKTIRSEFRPVATISQKNTAYRGAFGA